MNVMNFLDWNGTMRILEIKNEIIRLKKLKSKKLNAVRPENYVPTIDIHLNNLETRLIKIEADNCEICNEKGIYKYLKMDQVYGCITCYDIRVIERN